MIICCTFTFIYEKDEYGHVLEGVTLFLICSAIMISFVWIVIDLTMEQFMYIV